jgi:DNA-binding beta-propeller fold protein YncE
MEHLMNGNGLRGFVAVIFIALVTSSPIASAQKSAEVPQFVLDTSWPKPMPDHWQVGAVDGVFVDKHDLIWIGDQSNHLTKYDIALKLGQGDCCDPAPQIVAFNRKGEVVKHWDVSDDVGKREGFRGLDGVHTVYVDYKDNVWVTGHGRGDTQALKFTHDGKFLMQIGGSQAGGCCGNQDTANLGGGTGVAVWPATNEVFITDGYVNRRIIVFDADTGKFKRQWGAYGHPPPESVMSTKASGTGEGGVAAGTMVTPEPERKFEGPGATEWSTVHGVVITPDGVVWVADRIGNRLQRFHIDGTYIDEVFVDRKSSTSTGTVYSFAFSPDGKWVYVADGGNKRIHILDRKTMQEVGYIGGEGGQMPGAFNHVHVSSVDSAGNLYTGEAAAGARFQRWKLVKGVGYFPKSDTHLVDENGKDLSAK